MPSTSEPVHVDPAELRAAATKIDDHASEFAESHQGAQSRAGQVRLGAGLAGAALSEMLATMQSEGARLAQDHSAIAQGHRVGADVYEGADGNSARNISGVG